MEKVKSRDGIRLACHEAGRGDGRPAILVHGLTGNASIWADTHPMLAPRFRVVMPDLRGHGESGRTEDPDHYTIDHLVRDVFDVADGLGFDTFVLFGHGLGGTVAQLVAVEAPQRVDALVLVGAGPRPLDPRSGWAVTRERIAEVMSERGIEAAWDAYLESGIFGWDLDEVPSEIVERWRGEFLKTAPAAFIGLARSAAAQPDRTERLGGLSGVPTLVVVGSDDDAFRSDALDLAEAVGGAELLELPGGGHTPQISRSEAFNEAAWDFLKRAIPTTRG